MYDQIAIWLCSMKKVQKFLNSRKAIWPYTSHLNYYSAIRTPKYKCFYFEMSGQIALQPFSIKYAE